MYMAIYKSWYNDFTLSINGLFPFIRTNSCNHSIYDCKIALHKFSCKNIQNFSFLYNHISRFLLSSY